MDELTAFGALQSKLVALWPDMRGYSKKEQAVVVVPSLSLELPAELAPVLPAYEERFLFLLLLLQQPRLHVIYASSQPVYPRIVDYYLSLLPGLDSPTSRARLAMLSVGDPSARPLSQKLLDRPKTLDRIRALIPDPDMTHLVPFNTTELEAKLAVRLGIPMYAADPTILHFGTKSGGRRLFAQEGLPHPPGFEDVRTPSDLTDALRQLREADPTLRRAVVKLNEGVGGMGNAEVDVEGSDEVSLPARVENIALDGDATLDDFFAALGRQGGVVEARIEGAELRSPSVQIRISPDGEVELLSTHDQLLGGSSGQSYEGCTFPADASYAATITKEAAKVAHRLAREGVIGRFAVDFVVVRSDAGAWDPFAIEINLRKGGTTHPYLTLQQLTGGGYDPDGAVYRDSRGRPKYYVASDHLHGEGYMRLTPDDVLDLVAAGKLGWDAESGTGVVFHMISAIPVAGRIGVTAIGDSPDQAHALYTQTAATLEAAAV